MQECMSTRARYKLELKTRTMARFLDKTEHAVQHRLIREFDEDWYCYWDDSYGMPKNAVTDFGACVSA